MNEIILSQKGNTYIGALATKFATGRHELPEIFALDAACWHVFEVTPVGSIIHRASQFRRAGAEKYMDENRVLVHREEVAA